jgi:flagellar hook-associated protein 3 FlgL
MSLGAISPGRLPTSLIASSFLSSLNTTQDALATVQQQISTGQRFFNPSDDPTATSNILVLQGELNNQNQYGSNLTIAQSFLQNTDAALQNVSQSANQANALLLGGIGDTSTDAQRQSLADQIQTLIQGLANTANTQFQGRYIFAGSQSLTPPFQILADGSVRYNGDQFTINTNVTSSSVAASNIDGVTAFNAISAPVGSDTNPAATLQTQLSDLNAGRGVSAGSIQVTVNNGSPVTATIDLSKAKTLGDVQSLIQNAFAPGAVTVGIKSGVPQNGLQITAASGTVSVANTAGGQTAQDLGIVSAPTASIVGSDLNPQLTLQTPLSALNGGAGVSTSNGIQITNGSIQKVVDISSDATVQDLVNTLSSANADLQVGINAAGNGLAISTRDSGANFSIGENGGNDATSLGIRTLTSSTLLSSLNSGQGVPVNTTDSQGNPVPAPIQIQRRDGSTVSIDLSGSVTVQDVLDKINAVDPGHLVASLNSVGNGISIVDNDGSSTGPLTVESDAITTALGIDGTESSSDPTKAVVGKDVNPTQSTGIFSLLVQLESALRNNNQNELSTLQPLFTQEQARISSVQGDLGSHEQMLSQLQSQITTTTTNLTSSLSDQRDVDMASAITQLTQLTTAMQATLQTAASSLKMSLFNYL